MSSNKIYEVIIIGSGPAGYTASIYTARANLEPLLIAGYQNGGQLMQTTEVENYPGFPEGILGPQLMLNMRQQAERFGTEIIDKDVTKVDFNEKIKKVYIGDDIYQAKAVIVATGASAKWLEVEGEDKFKGRGVSSCATCDGAFFKNRVIAVVGGGDSAMEEANFLTRFASKLYIIHRREEFRASKIMQDRVLNNPKVEVIWNTEVKEIKGDDSLKSLVIYNNKEDKTEELEVDGLFVAIGHTPITDFLAGALEVNEKGYLQRNKGINTSLGETNQENEVHYETQSSTKGVFIAGDVHDYVYRQAVTAAGEGCKAALECEKYLDELSS